MELITEISVGLAGGNKWAIKAEELAVAKDCFRGRMALDYDKPETVLGSALEDSLFQEKIYSPEEVIERVEKVSLREVQDLAREIFKKENLSIAVVGDYKKLDFSL
jgi:predicted Zn-dependent peptidase